MADASAVRPGTSVASEPPLARGVLIAFTVGFLGLFVVAPYRCRCRSLAERARLLFERTRRSGRSRRDRAHIRGRSNRCADQCGLRAIRRVVRVEIPLLG
jgi:hypothetical protein